MSELTDNIKRTVAGNSINAVMDSLLDLLVAYMIINYADRHEGELQIRTKLIEEIIKAYNANYQFRDKLIKEQTVRIQ